MDENTAAPADRPVPSPSAGAASTHRGLLDQAFQPLPPPPPIEIVQDASAAPPADVNDPREAAGAADDARFGQGPVVPRDAERVHGEGNTDEIVGEWDIPLETFRAHLQRVELPQPIDLLAARELTVSSMEEFQSAIAPNTIINVSGALIATGETRVSIADVQNLIIRFEPGAEIQYRGGQSWSGLIQIAPTARKIRIESPRIIGTVGTKQTCMGIEILHTETPDLCQDIVIVDGEFRGLNYAIQAHGGCRRMLVQDCKAFDLIDYFFFGAKNVQDLTISGCTAHGIKSNHVIRIFDANGVNIFRNSLKVDSVSDEQMKRTIWILNGRNVTIAANKTYDGRVTIGPNPVAAESSPNDRIGFVNIVYNRINHTHTNTAIELLSGAHDVFITGNNITTPFPNWLGIGGWNEHQRPITKVHWTDGMVVNGNVVNMWEGVRVSDHYKDQLDIGPIAVGQ